VKWTSWVTLVGLVAIVAIVVGSSFEVGTVRCEVCIDFHGRQACRAVDGATRDEAQRAAVTNACALLASGVTDSMACERTEPTRSDCTAP
jgi:AhpD family alkylhydroperoxidase